MRRKYWIQGSLDVPNSENVLISVAVFNVLSNDMWRETHHTAVGLACSEGSDHKRDVQISINPPALVATLQTADIILQLPLVQLVDQVGLRIWRHDMSGHLTSINSALVCLFSPWYLLFLKRGGANVSKLFKIDTYLFHRKVLLCGAKPLKFGLMEENAMSLPNWKGIFLMGHISVQVLQFLSFYRQSDVVVSSTLPGAFHGCNTLYLYTLNAMQMRDCPKTCVIIPIYTVHSVVLLYMK